MSALVDEEKVCRDCTQKFVFAVRDQEFFAKMNFTAPNRCKPCRDKRKAEKNGTGAQQQGGGKAPFGVSQSNPITEYRAPRFEAPRFEGSGSRAASPPPSDVPSRDDKNEGRRRGGGGGRSRRFDVDDIY